MKKVLFILAISAVCLSATDNCQFEYADTETDKTGCRVCKGGFFQKEGEKKDKKTNYVCQACQEGCFTCTSDKDCTQCKSGWFKPPAPGQTRRQLQKATICKKCIDNCAECTSTETCNKCAVGFGPKVEKKSSLTQGLVTKSCVACTLANCGDCSVDSTKCKGCKNTHYPVKEGEELKECKECEGGCSTCTSKTECSSCKDNFFFNAAAKTCPKCDESCATCRGDAKQCVNCTQGYSKPDATPKEFQLGQLPETGACHKCSDTNCAKCNKADTCDKCIDKFEIQDDKKTCKKKGTSLMTYLIALGIFILLIVICVVVAMKQKGGDGEGSYHEETGGNNGQYQSFSKDKEEDNPIGI